MRKLFIAVAVVCLASSVRGANATLLWSWEILNNGVTIGQNDQLTIMGRLSNLSGSDRNFTADDIGGYGILDSELRPLYEVLDSLPAEPNQFENLDLAPGQTFDFHHFILVPKTDNPITGDRTFTFDTSFVINQSKPDIVPTGFIINSYTFNVEVSGREIPAPAPIFLMAIGLVSCLLRGNGKPKQSA